MRRYAVLLVSAAACSNGDARGAKDNDPGLDHPGATDTPHGDDDVPMPADTDHDGVPDAEDCAPDDPDVYPGAYEPAGDIWTDPACDGYRGRASLADYAFMGEAAGDWVGNSLSSAGDIDGDGLDDLLIAAGSSSEGASGAGKVHIVLSSSLPAPGGAPISLSGSDYSFVGQAEVEFLGTSLSTAGDLDGDGLDDILFTSWGMADDPVQDGRTHVFLGATLLDLPRGEVDLDAADYVLDGEHRDDHATVVSTAGDVDGDGLDDIVIGAPDADHSGSFSGKAYVVLGQTLVDSPVRELNLLDADYALIAESEHDNVGASVASAGDVDGDGLDDILIGAFGADHAGASVGKAYLVLGSSLAATTDTTLQLADADATFVGETTGFWTGDPVSSAGDVDGDGLDDILVGARMDSEVLTEAGKAYLVYGRTIADEMPLTVHLADADHTFLGLGAHDNAGHHVSAAGDVDNDGLDDILIGAPRHSTSERWAGHVYLLYGKDLAATTESTLSLTNASATIIGEADYDELGTGSAPAGDVNGDGYGDFLVGARLNDGVGARDAGKAYLFLGR